MRYAPFANRVIAEQLVITLDTVKRHVSHVLDKLGAANRIQAGARAASWGCCGRWAARRRPAA